MAHHIIGFLVPESWMNVKSTDITLDLSQWSLGERAGDLALEGHHDCKTSAPNL